jgi:PTS system mannose-specific IIA component
MPGLLVVTHGRLAEDLVEALSRIVGEVPRVEAVSIDWNVDADEAARRIRDACQRLDRGAGVLILTDMFGGTPTNLALSMLEPGRREIVTGVNLPMLIRFAGLRSGLTLEQATESIAAQGRESIRIASRLLADGRGGGNPERG